MITSLRPFYYMLENEFGASEVNTASFIPENSRFASARSKYTVYD